MPRRGGASSAASCLVASCPSESPSPFASVTLGAPNEKPLVVEVGTAPASGVLGGLPKPNPTGFPMLPLPLGFPNPNVGLGELEPKANGDDEPDDGLSVVRPPPKTLGLGVESFGLSFCSGFAVADTPNIALEKTEGVLPNTFSPVFFPESPNANELVELDEPKAKADLTPFEDGPPSTGLLVSSAGFSPKLDNGLFAGGLDASCGLKPPSLGGVDEVAGAKLKPENPPAGAGIENELLGCDEGAGAELEAKEEPPNPVKADGAAGGGGGSFASGFVVAIDDEDFLRLSS